MSCTTRLTAKDDVIHIRNMIQELADFEKMPHGPKLTLEDLIRDGFETTPSLYTSIVGEIEGMIVGYAILFNTYSTWEGKSLMLEDLYVKPAYRKNGVGEKIYRHVLKFALSTGCSRVDFHVLNWNPAKDFYEKRAAKNLTEIEEWQYYRLTTDQIAEYLNTD